MLDGRPTTSTVMALVAAATIGATGFASAAQLNLVSSIPLGPIAGEITDLEFDYANQRLFVLEHDSGAIAIIDLPTGTVVQTLAGLKAPRGLAHEPPNSQLYVAMSDGKLAVLHGVPLQRTSILNIGTSLGPPYYDASSTRVFIGFDRRAIAVVDTAHNKALHSIDLDGDPGPLAFEALGTRMFAGAVGENRILVADRALGKQIGSWSTGGSGEVAALAVDEDAGLLIVAFRKPAGFAWFDLAGGSPKGRIDACAEPASLLADSIRARFYLTCGEGRIQIFQRDAGGTYANVGAIDTQPGAKAAVLAAGSGRLYLAVPAISGRGAEIRIYAPGP